MIERNLSKTRKMTPPIINDKNITYSNSSLKIWKEREYATELIPVKSYKSGLIYLVVITATDIQIVC